MNSEVTEPTLLKCKECGIEFHPRAHNQVFCCKKCTWRNKRRRERAKEQAARPEIRCLICGSVIPPGSRRRYYCSPGCALEARKRLMKSTRRR